MRGRTIGIAVLTVLMLAGWLTAGTARAAAAEDTAAVSYCHAKGGAVVNRVPFFGTNGSEKTWVRLAGNANFCVFTAKDKSSIEVLLPTLYTEQPSLAALAYYSKQPYKQKLCSSASASPASCYCAQLGGADTFGGSPGGWVNKSNANVTIDTCIFSDRSSIDSFGLFDHQGGVILGKNLDGVLRYKNPNK